MLDPWAAHPRARGKYFALAHFSPPQPRSPPRTREIQPSIPLQIPKIPFTPACAGNTLLRFRNVRYRTAYPYGAGNTGSSTAMTGAATEYLHAGGQHQNPDFLPGYISRLPPRTREIRKHAAVVVGQHPLTPAHAGNTRKQRHRSHRMPAHPRARGKYWHRMLFSSQTCRSPPRTREIRRRPGTCPCACTAHPRARGKYGIVALLIAYFARSPPRTREIPHVPRRISWQRPLTPAHAGNKVPISLNFEKLTAHPRARGKYSSRGFS
ncbi:Uncharacterised protein [Ectopseudomonas oleovorans]|uniref:Uncharacterized protein n=1 Tax=Ectopseudomonas oleovorans TaxID=301 RepID=A0A379PLQ7_ECTOL|nr:Uncharacterised protein [Pseudomonas oleovorans]